MRFRPVAATGMVISAVSLRLNDSHRLTTPQGWRQLVYDAFEQGINAFEVAGRQPVMIEGFGQAVQAVERRLLFVSLRLGPTLSSAGALMRDFSPDSLIVQLESFLARTGLDYVDAVMLDDPKGDELSPAALDELKAMRESGRARMLGVSGADDAMDAYISVGAFDLLSMPFSILSGWKERLRLKAAMEKDMALLAYDYFPARFHAGAAPKPEKRDKHSRALDGVGTYAFLDRTNNWNAEEICLAYALTEPGLASVQIDADLGDRIETLATIPERDLPTGVAAQIEMARFTPVRASGKAQKASRA
jgi:aryl-alcohol dehydrogenase-like predicted oxidoreductase